jgi:hypothetical protein
MGAQAFNLSYLGCRDGKDCSSRPAWAKWFWDPHLNQWLGLVARACHSGYMGKHKLEGCSPDWQGIKWGTISKITKQKGLVQVVKCLPSKDEVWVHPLVLQKKKKERYLLYPVNRLINLRLILAHYMYIYIKYRWR